MPVANPSPSKNPAILILLGLIFSQFAIYGPSLVGKKILLPLDVLTAPGMYLPVSNENVHLENFYLTDLVCLSEPMRRFAHSEFASGRLPMWAPYQYAGAPFLGPKFSPFVLPQYLVGSPCIIAWMQLVAACVAGFGMFFFCRGPLGLSFWPGAIAAWCYPLTGFFVFWQGYYLVWPVYWLPWLLAAVHATVYQKERYGPHAVALITALTFVSGNPDTAGQVLLLSGIFALCQLASTPNGHARGSPQDQASSPRFFHRISSFPTRALCALAAAFILGVMLAAPYLLPLIEYSKTGARLQLRKAGSEERPPVGLRALPQIVLPDMYGAQAKPRTGFRFVRETQLESSAGAYAGVLATALLAPLAFQQKRHRPASLCLAALTFISLSWTLNIPGLVSILRLPGLNMMSHNRLVFGAAFGLIALAAIGLETLRQNDFAWNRLLLLPAGLLIAIFGWSLFGATVLPPILEHLPDLLRRNGTVLWIADMDSVQHVQDLFRLQFVVTAVFAAVGLATLLLLRSHPEFRPHLVIGISSLLVLDLLWFAHGRNPQCSPALYYPPLDPIPQLAAKLTSPGPLAKKETTPGTATTFLPVHAPLARARVVAYKSLPPQLLSTFGLHDIRGYDGVDPARYVQLLTLAGTNLQKFEYSAVQWFTPETNLSAEGNVLLHPVLDLLGVRHVIFRGTPAPAANPSFESDDYWVLTNLRALPRAFVPSHVELVPDADTRLAKLGSRMFDPREVAFIEQPVTFPAQSRGAVEVVRDLPTSVALNLQMENPGLVVLADMWDPGWMAYINGKGVPILITDHALRGVAAPAGPSRLEFRYQPKSFELGLKLAAAALLGLTVWVTYLSKTLPPIPHTQGHGSDTL